MNEFLHIGDLNGSTIVMLGEGYFRPVLVYPLWVNVIELLSNKLHKNITQNHFMPGTHNSHEDALSNLE